MISFNIFSLPCHSSMRAHESTTTHASDAADAGASILSRTWMRCILVYKRKKMHTLHKTAILNVWRFRHRGWLLFFCPALLIWTRIYRRWTKKDGRTTSERWLLRQQHLTHVSWYTHERASKTYTEEKKLLNKVIIKKKICLPTKSILIQLRLNHWCHMDYFKDVLTTFLGLERGSCIAVYAGSESSRISSNISYSAFRRWMKVLRVLEQHEGE